MNSNSDIPTHIADDAPDPDQFDAGEAVETTYKGHIAFDHDGARYCPDCINPEYADLCLEDPRKIPHGGPVEAGAEADCPGYYGCGHCNRKITGFTALHYGGVCDPFTCPDMATRIADPDGRDRTAEAAILERDGGDVRVMLREDFKPHGETGDTSWIPESDLRPVE